MTHVSQHLKRCRAERSRSEAKRNSGGVEASLPESNSRRYRFNAQKGMAVAGDAPGLHQFLKPKKTNAPPLAIPEVGRLILCSE